MINRCQLWPDVMPKSDHTGLKQGRLTYLQPVGITLIHGRYKEWLWLCECECGRERIIRAKGNYISCGECRVYKKRHRKSDDKFVKDESKEEYKEVKFDRNGICIRKHKVCIYYQECQDERLFKGVVSERYVEGGGCFKEEPEHRQGCVGIDTASPSFYFHFGTNRGS